MNEETRQRISLMDRKKLFIEGVSKVEKFDDREILLETNMGYLVLKGEGLHVTMLNLDTGNLEVEGYFVNISYLEDGKEKSIGKKSKGFLKRLLK